MLRIFELKLPLDHTDDDLRNAAARALDVSRGRVIALAVRRRAIDARNKTSIRLIYTVDVELEREQSVTIRDGRHRIAQTPDESYHLPAPGIETLAHRPVVVGSGPAGLFAALTMAQAGLRPIVLERGKAVGERCADVERFWREGTLDPQSNAQFGEGGAGTFSDGKLNTLINDPRCRKVLDEFVAAGAPPEILTSAKPHIGTDRLRGVVRAIREAIIRPGGEVRFGQRVCGLRVRDGSVCGVEIDGGDVIECEIAILAIGHSARDTFRMLLDAGVPMRPKPFSIGVRIEHPQQLIDEAQFGACAGHPQLGTADYKMAFHAPGGRSAYTFCMCPGGEVIAAASEEGGVVVNGMSRSARDGVNANSALLVGVAPTDFGGDHPLAGCEFQRKWESLAFEQGGRSFAAPVQRLADFVGMRPSTQLGAVQPTYLPGVVPGDLRGCLPGYVCDTIARAIPAFARQLRGFDLPDAVLTGVETRSSSPVRIVRGDGFESAVCGLYPAGEGAGYAGGIMSAAVDGIRVAEAVVGCFAPP